MLLPWVFVLVEPIAAAPPPPLPLRVKFPPLLLCLMPAAFVFTSLTTLALPPVAVAVDEPPLADAPRWVTFMIAGRATRAAPYVPAPMAMPAPAPATRAVTGAGAYPVETGTYFPGWFSNRTTFVGGLTPSPGLDTMATLWFVESILSRTVNMLQPASAKLSAPTATKPHFINLSNVQHAR